MGFSKGAWLHRGWKRKKIMNVSRNSRYGKQLSEHRAEYRKVGLEQRQQINTWHPGQQQAQESCCAGLEMKQMV